MSAIIEYFEALERLKNNNPQVLPKGAKITKDAVALEAGRKKGSIKKGRESFAQLIEAIDQAANNQGKSAASDKERLNKAKEKLNNYRKLYEDALAREVMLIRRVYELEAEIAKLTENRVTPINQNNGQ